MNAVQWICVIGAIALVFGPIFIVIAGPELTVWVETLAKRLEK